MSERESERYAKALEAARKLFRNDRDAEGWLNEPSWPLGDVKPVTLLATEEGLERVLYELGQMEYGHPA